MRLIMIFIFGLFLFGSSAQTKTNTITIPVKGNCDQCKERIENAADIKGVKLCTWNEKTQTATVIYDPGKVKQQQIEEAIAKSGHDAGAAKAQGSYTKLPDCCKYRDKKCEKKE